MVSRIKIFNRHLLLNVAVASLLVSSISCAMESSEEAKKASHSYQTPVKAQQQIERIGLTPGEEIVQKQTVLFNRDKFVQIFTEEKVQDYLDQNVDWTLFSSPELAFDHSSKRNTLRTIRDFLSEHQTLNKDADSLYTEMLKLDNETKKVHQKRIQEITRMYFEQEFPSSKISFGSKRAGDQLGTRAILTIEGKKPIIYHVKTHSSGLKSENSSAAQQVDPKELIVYKVLQYCGLGCETNFFGRDFNNLYIATKDAGMEQPFQEYKNIRKTKSSLGVISDTDYELLNNKNYAEALEKNITENRPSQNYVEGVVSLDLLSRILRLTDLQTNDGNFGFLINESNVIDKVKVLDFRLSKDISFKVSEDHFNGFMEGNGVFNYSQEDMAMLYALKKRPQDKRVLEAKNVFNKYFNNFQLFLKNAEEDVEHVITALNPKGLDHSDSQKLELIKQLKQYAEDLEHNFAFFGKKLNTFSF